MVARGALTRPWVFREIAAALRGEPVPAPPSLRRAARAAAAPPRRDGRARGRSLGHGGDAQVRRPLPHRHARARARSATASRAPRAPRSSAPSSNSSFAGRTSRLDVAARTARRTRLRRSADGSEPAPVRFACAACQTRADASGRRQIALAACQSAVYMRAGRRGRHAGRPESADARRVAITPVAIASAARARRASAISAKRASSASSTRRSTSSC